MKVPCVTCYGRIQMTGVDGEFRPEVLDIRSGRTFRKPSITTMG